MARSRNQFGLAKVAATVGLLLVAAIAVLAWDRLLREAPETTFRNDAERFKYGSLGAEQTVGMPYWVFLVLPRVFPEYLPGPGGYAALGLPWEAGHDLPVGFSRRRIGYLRVAANCALCHVTRYRRDRDRAAELQPGGTGNSVDIYGLLRFLSAVATDPRFNADTLIAAIQRVQRLDWIDRLLYRYYLIPDLRRRLLQLGERFRDAAPPDARPWGRGRDECMQLIQVFLLGREPEAAFAPTDIPAIWRLSEHKDGARFGWDGASRDRRSALVDAALSMGIPAGTSLAQQADWLQTYLSTLAPAAYPFDLDPVLIESGRALFESQCARCHDSDRTGRPIPIAEVGTDPRRLSSWDIEAAAALNGWAQAQGVERAGMVEQTLIGYRIPFLDGLWLRGPYLHNGSVPTLAELLEPVERRSRVFYRGYDLLDPTRVGFINQGEAAAREGTRIDVTEPGNGNGGHLFGTGLLPEEKRALLEFLKTL